MTNEQFIRTSEKDMNFAKQVEEVTLVQPAAEWEENESFGHRLQRFCNGNCRCQQFSTGLETKHQKFVQI